MSAAILSRPLVSLALPQEGITRYLAQALLVIGGTLLLTLSAKTKVVLGPAAIVGWAADRGWDRNPFKLFGAMLAGEVVMMAMGFAWLAVIIGVGNSWQFGVAPFILPDLIKVALASAIVPAVWSLFARR